MKNLLYFILIFLYSCSPKLSNKNNFYEKGGVNEARMNSINDFAKNSPLFKKDLVFLINEYKLDSNLIVLTIIGEENKFYPTKRNTIGSSFDDFPTRYSEKKGKLFCWYDSNYKITNELVAMLSKYKKIDSSLVNQDNRLLAKYRVDDSKKAEGYYFCKENLKRFKKVRTSIATGYYDIPKVDCSGNVPN